jgi:hypothetical protein
MTPITNGGDQQFELVVLVSLGCRGRFLMFVNA